MEYLIPIIIFILIFNLVSGTGKNSRNSSFNRREGGRYVRTAGGGAAENLNNMFKSTQAVEDRIERMVQERLQRQKTKTQGSRSKDLPESRRRNHADALEQPREHFRDQISSLRHQAALKTEIVESREFMQRNRNEMKAINQDFEEYIARQHAEHARAMERYRLPQYQTRSDYRK